MNHLVLIRDHSGKVTATKDLDYIRKVIERGDEVTLVTLGPEPLAAKVYEVDEFPTFAQEDLMLFVIHSDYGSKRQRVFLTPDNLVLAGWA